MDLRDRVINDLESLIKKHREYRTLKDDPNLRRIKFYEIITSSKNYLAQFFGKNSIHFTEYDSLTDKEKRADHAMFCMIGVLNSAKNDFINGRLSDIKTLVSSEIFDNSLEQAKELLKKKYKDASAVIAGATLENGLRTLCEINMIQIKDKDNNIIENPKLDRMNNELAKHGTYNKFKQKSITTWADLRNNAAHGHYNEYTIDDVHLMVAGIENFFADYL